MKMFFASLLRVASLVITLVLAVMRYGAGVIGLGDIQYFASLSEQMSGGVTAIFDMVINVHTNLGKISAVRDFLAWAPKIISGGNMAPGASPEIRFDNVGFKYHAHDEWVLRNCSFTIPGGKHVSVVGSNGAGKSTIVKLILRLYDPDEGTIFVDGVDARQYDPAKLRQIFGVQFQDVVVYSTDIAQNIALCDVEDYDNDRLKEAIAFAGLAEYVDSLPDGIETAVTKLFDENGVELSGGLKQRLSLARAFYRQSDFLILDEPSASLDPGAEYMVFAKLAHLWRGKSALLISHRLANVRHCDNILVLDNGKVAESGSHRELLLKRGKYADLYKLQADKYVALDLPQT
jgi:ATP-binding cassette subfamily B protein